jgi:hypothetical protein
VSIFWLREDFQNIGETILKEVIVKNVKDDT